MMPGKQRFRKHYPIEPEEKVPTDPDVIEILQEIRRVIAFCYGWDGANAVRIRCTSAGYLQVGTGQTLLVNTEGTRLKFNEVGSGAGSDAYVEHVFTNEQCVVDLTVWDFAAMVKIHTAGETYGPEFEVAADTVYPIPMNVKAISVKNKTGGSNARWQAVGYYPEAGYAPW